MIMIASAIRYTWISKVAIESFINIVDGHEQELDPAIFPEKDIQKSFDAQSLAVKSYLLIQTCAFLEEYKLFHKIKPEDPVHTQESIRFKKEIKAILKPAISYINESWVDLYQARNQVLAHGWRVGGGDAIMFTDMVNHPLNVPLIDEEFTLLVGIMGSMIDVLQEYNPAYFAELDAFMKDRGQNLPRHLTRTTSHEFSMEQFRAVKALMQLELRTIRGI